MNKYGFEEDTRDARQEAIDRIYEEHLAKEIERTWRDVPAGYVVEYYRSLKDFASAKKIPDIKQTDKERKQIELMARFHKAFEKFKSDYVSGKPAQMPWIMNNKIILWDIPAKEK